MDGFSRPSRQHSQRARQLRRHRCSARNGWFYAVQDFAQSFENESLEQLEKQVASLLTAKGLRVAGTAEEARRACDGLVGIPSGRSGALIRFETGSLSEIPPELDKKIRGEPFRNVSVGACRTREAPGFTRYKIALLFF